MQIKKPLLIAGAIATIGVASTAVGVQAATSNTTGESGLVDKIAQKFNLNKDDVQKVFDEDKASHEAEHKAKLEERLDQAVKDGKITEEQKSKILAKIEELKTQMESQKEEFKNKTPEERKALMEQHHAELEQWAKDNNIPMEYLMVRVFKGGPGPGHGEGAGMRMHIEDGSDSGPSTSTLTD